LTTTIFLAHLKSVWLHENAQPKKHPKHAAQHAADKLPERRL